MTTIQYLKSYGKYMCPFEAPYINEYDEFVAYVTCERCNEIFPYKLIQSSHFACPCSNYTPQGLIRRVNKILEYYDKNPKELHNVE